MSEMVERVARAIQDYHRGRGGPGHAWRWLDDDEKDKYRALARRAIKAMREPTPEIIRAWWDIERVRPNNDFRTPEDMGKAMWTAMIDAALK